MTNLAARLRVYAPDGAALGVLTEPADWQASLPVNDVSALKVAYPVAAANAGLLDVACEVAVEVNSGQGWVEPRNARYRRIEVDADRANRAADVASYTMPGYASLLDGCVVVPAKYGVAANYDEDGKRKFLSATVGQILSTVLLEARGLVTNLIPGLTLGFTPTADSLGKAWSRRVTIYYEPGLSLLTILDNLAQQGQCDWWLEGRTLRVVNPDSGAADTSVRLDGDPSAMPVRSSLAGLLHTAFLVGESETWRVDNPGTPTPWGTSMRVLTQGGVKDAGTARELIGAELASGAAERVEYTWAAPVAAARALPLVDYRPGDYVQARGKAGAWERMRVHQVTLDFGRDGLAANLTLNDRFVDAEVRRAKRMKGIVNGASGDAGTGGLPRAERAIPATPQGLVSESVGYWADNGMPMSQVTVSWAPVTVDTTGTAITLAHYVVSVGGRTVETSGTSVTVDGLECGSTARISVRAVSLHRVAGGAATGSRVCAWPLARLDPPTVLGATCEYGIVTLSWDGKLKTAGGQAYVPPKHMARLDVQEASSPGGPWKTLGAVVAGANILTVDRQSVIGQTRWYRGVAVDRLEAASDPGPAVQVVVSSLVSEALAAADARITAEAASAAQKFAEATTQINTVKTGLTTAQTRADQAFATAEAAQSAATAADSKASAATTKAQDAHNAAVDAWTKALTAAESGGNLILNGGFEQGRAEWSNYSNAPLVAGRISNYALRLGPGPVRPLQARRIRVSTGRKIYMQAWIRRESGTENPNVRLQALT